MSFPVLIILTLFGAGLALFVSNSFKLRFILFAILVFLSLSRLPLGAVDPGSMSLRIPLVLLLLFSSYRTLPDTIHRMYRNRLLGWSTLWFLYVFLSWLYMHGTRVFLFEHIGNYVFFILTVSMLERAKEKQLISLLILVGISQIPGVLMGIPAMRAPLMKLGFYWGTVYHQRSAQAGVYLLPVLLLWLDRIRNKGLLSYIPVVSLIIILFLVVITTGARTPTMSFGLTLIYWLRRNRTYMIILALITLSGIYLAPNITTEETMERYMRAYGAFATGQLEEASNVEFRYEHMILGIEAFSRSPILGHGHRSWLRILGEDKGIIGYNMAPHNELIRLLVEYGLIGFLFFTMFIISCNRKPELSGRGAIIPSARYTFMIMTLSMVLLNFFHNSLFTRHFFFILGATAGLYLNRRNRNNRHTPLSMPVQAERTQKK
ncbi:hypothetical protein CSA37_07550 [Candidatus Fermentibacteria bacterium]|nr:MAG: hypothetical protein CSA37_07550 [Candidatus Fermentibacteria bacterium]